MLEALIVEDAYVLGHLAYQTDANGTVLATFTYDSTGVPVSVQVGSDPATAPRSYYVYNGHGDTVALVDAAGNTVASYGYDSFGLLMSDTESFANGWSNPYRYDGRDGVRYDRETGLYWMQVRAYDPALGRFLSRDPLGRSPLFFADQPYVYAGNNPLINVDPSGAWSIRVGCNRLTGASRWYGYLFWLNHCLLDFLTSFRKEVGTGAAVTALTTLATWLLPSPVLKAVFLVLAAWTVVHLYTLSKFDEQCRQRGAYEKVVYGFAVISPVLVAVPAPVC